MQCPCLSSKSFESCCEPILQGQQAQTAEELMRARYTAYTQINMDFIEKTHDPNTKKDIDMDANKEWAENTEWAGLQILSTEAGLADDDWGKVEFKAQFLENGEMQTHHEISEFNKRDGKWYFTIGRSSDSGTIINTEPKVGRNDPCVCGSGKKFKKCCG